MVEPSSKIHAVRIKNQVSFGAGETIMAKTCFEEWLCDVACAEIKQMYSDNGMFVADVF